MDIYTRERAKEIENEFETELEVKTNPLSSDAGRIYLLQERLCQLDARLESLEQKHKELRSDLRRLDLRAIAREIHDQ